VINKVTLAVGWKDKLAVWLGAEQLEVLTEGFRLTQCESAWVGAEGHLCAVFDEVSFDDVAEYVAKLYHPIQIINILSHNHSTYYNVKTCKYIIF
jgi:hypothetical protein